jgi:predicted metal-dependent hydrolase
MVSGISGVTKMLQLSDCPPIKFTRRKGQKSIRIRIKPGEIVVSAPFFCSERAVKDFVNEKETWIRASLKRMNGKKDEQKDILASHQNDILLRGEWVPITIRHARPNEKDWLLIERQGRIDAYPPDKVGSGELTLFSNTDVTPVFVPNEVKREFLYQKARTELPDTFRKISSELPFKWTRIFIRSQRTKWGTCSSRGNISLNWRLIMCPPEITRYLVVHELCHTVHMNHSKAYWKLVSEHYPEVNAANKWLKTRGNLCFLI